MSREENIYFAKLAEKSERYDDMAEYMELVVKCADELSSEERNLLSVAYKNAVGSRRAAWGIIRSVGEKEKGDDNGEQAGFAKKYRGRVESELQKICDTILGLLDSTLIPKASKNEYPESKVFYLKMKADYYRYIAEFTDGEKKSDATEKARQAYQEAHGIAAQGLEKTHPIRLGLALNYSVFQYEVLSNTDEACKIARTAFEDAMAELDSIKSESYKDSTCIMQLLKDNLTLWTSEEGDA